MEIEEEPLVKTAATLFQRLCYNYRDELSAGIICAGWDRKVGAQVMPLALAFLLVHCGTELHAASYLVAVCIPFFFKVKAYSMLSSNVGDDSAPGL